MIPLWRDANGVKMKMKSNETHLQQMMIDFIVAGGR